MYAGGGRNLLRKTLRQRDRRASGLETPPDADDHESTNPRGASAREDGLWPFWKVFGVEVAMRINEHEVFRRRAFPKWKGIT
jgi:hypothetical protein